MIKAIFVWMLNLRYKNFLDTTMWWKFLYMYNLMDCKKFCLPELKWTIMPKVIHHILLRLYIFRVKFYILNIMANVCFISKLYYPQNQFNWYNAGIVFNIAFSCYSPLLEHLLHYHFPLLVCYLLPLNTGFDNIFKQFNKCIK